MKFFFWGGGGRVRALRILKYSLKKILKKDFFTKSIQNWSNNEEIENFDFKHGFQGEISLS